MAKTRRMIAEHLKLVDAVCEMTDARIPAASRNPELHEILGDKPRLLVINRADQADAAGNAAWVSHCRRHGQAVLLTDSKSGAGVSRLAPAVRALLKEKIEAGAAHGRTGRVLRLMVVGVPNVGKSSLINRLAGRRAAAAEDRPGVTRGRQWVNLSPGLALLDTPGILWPKFEDEGTGMLLAYTGAIRDEILDAETLAAHLAAFLQERYPEALASRYRLGGNVGGRADDGTGDHAGGTAGGDDGMTLLARAARGRGFLAAGGLPDTERMARVLLDEFRGGKLGRFTLEWPAAGRDPQVAGGEA
ncbi:MAG: ribosome biogenesis GTPase YlqF [Oscillospiraceae bacterium]|nr:ribosome biogenesis GTPase YlqF [Oscillospiraceae bacterium]